MPYRPQSGFSRSAYNILWFFFHWFQFFVQIYWFKKNCYFTLVPYLFSMKYNYFWSNIQFFIPLNFFRCVNVAVPKSLFVSSWQLQNICILNGCHRSKWNCHNDTKKQSFLLRILDTSSEWICLCKFYYNCVKVWTSHRTTSVRSWKTKFQLFWAKM